jgi:aspartate aminotransferase-like enzyme
MFLMAPPGKSLFYFSRKSRETSSSVELSSLSLDVERNFNPEFKHIFCQ